MASQLIVSLEEGLDTGVVAGMARCLALKQTVCCFCWQVSAPCWTVEVVEEGGKQ